MPGGEHFLPPHAVRFRLLSVHDWRAQPGAGRWYTARGIQGMVGASKNVDERRTHMVNIVQLPNGTQFHVDVAFSGDGPTRPQPLISGAAVRDLSSQEVRLT